jgi:hypothetical protein
MLFRYFLNDFEMVSLAPVITGIAVVFTFHMHGFSTIRYFCNNNNNNNNNTVHIMLQETGHISLHTYSHPDSWNFL